MNNPHLSAMSYSVEDLLTFINSCYDVCVLEDSGDRRYFPRTKKWLADELVNFLHQQAIQN